MPCCHEFTKHEDEIYYAEIEACYSTLKEIDDVFGSKEIRLQLLGEKNADKYENQPIVRAVVDLEVPRTTSDRPTPNSNWSWHTTTTLRALRSLIRKTESERRSR